MKNIDLEAGFIEADRLMQNGDYKSSVKLLKKYRKKFQGNPLVSYNLGVVYYKAGMIIEAIYSLEEAVKQGGNEPEVFNQLGLAYEKNKDLPAARAYYKKALDMDPFFSPAWNNLGVSYFLAEDYNAARDYFERALEVNSSDPDAWFNLRDTCTELGMKEDAAAADLKYHELVRH